MTLLWGAALRAQEAVTLSAPDALIETGLLDHLLPRFSLKTGVRLERVSGPEAAVVISSEADAGGTAVMQGLGQVWSLRHDASPKAVRFADWLTSEIGQRTIASFAPDGSAPFGPPPVIQTAEATQVFEGDPTLGLEVSEAHCSRCHAVIPGKRYNDIGSTPSFFVLRSLADWQARFTAFYALNPHPAFTQIAGVTAPFPESRPPPIAPITLTPDEVAAVLAYVAGLEAADLGAALAHQ